MINQQQSGEDEKKKYGINGKESFSFRLYLIEIGVKS